MANTESVMAIDYLYIYTLCSQLQNHALYKFTRFKIVFTFCGKQVFYARFEKKELQ